MGRAWRAWTLLRNDERSGDQTKHPSWSDQTGLQLKKAPATAPACCRPGSLPAIHTQEWALCKDRCRGPELVGDDSTDRPGRRRRVGARKMHAFSSCTSTGPRSLRLKVSDIGCRHPRAGAVVDPSHVTGQGCTHGSTPMPIAERRAWHGRMLEAVDQIAMVPRAPRGCAAGHFESYQFAQCHSGPVIFTSRFFGRLI